MNLSLPHEPQVHTYINFSNDGSFAGTHRPAGLLDKERR